MKSLPQELSIAIASLSSDRQIKLLDLRTAVQTAIVIKLDDLGVPRIQEVSGVSLDFADRASNASVLVCVGSNDIIPGPVERLLRDQPSAALFRVSSDTSVRSVAAEVIANSSIRQRYELILARVAPGSGRILLSSALLFPSGSRRGATAELTVKSVCSDKTGTVLAVVAWDPVVPVARLISAFSTTQAPGSLLVRSKLLGPGLVEFTEPAGVTWEGRSLDELLESIPGSINSVYEAHLICAVDTTGAAAEVAARLYRVEKFITSMHTQFPADGQLKVGIVAYGAHRRKKRQQDDRVVITDWGSPPRDAARSLGRLGAARPDEDGASQVEDALAAIEGQLRRERQSQRTALVVFGDGQPYPAKDSDAIPACPRGHDWERIMDTLHKQGCSLAAVRDRPSRQGARTWRRLGSGMVFAVDSFNADLIGKRVGLVVPSLEHMPFPLASGDDGQTGRVAALR